MRKPIIPRILLITLIYCAVFVTLVSIQFAKRGGFTRKVGSFVVSGQYRLPDEGSAPLRQNEYNLDGDAHVFFGGMDFGLVDDDNGPSFMLIYADETKIKVAPELMVILEESAKFLFPQDVEILFSTHYSGGALELRITGIFPEGIIGAELPFKPLRKTSINDAGDGHFIISSDGNNYTFGASPLDLERMVLLMGNEVQISLRAIPERKTLSSNDYILARASTPEDYNTELSKWRDNNYSLWNRTIQDQLSEDTVVAYAGEALARGTYRAAVAAVSPAFLRSAGRTYESSVYLGSIGDAQRLLITREREKIALLSRQLNDKSLEFLKEPRVIKYLAIRGQNNFINTGADLVRTIDPAILALDITPGILEGYIDWKTYRPNTDNPFERIVDQACFVITESLEKIGSDPNEADTLVFSFLGSEDNTAFNLRLGKALLAYAEDVNDTVKAGIARSLILSSLSMAGMEGEPSAARLYRILTPLDAYPRAVSISDAPNNVWAWTTAPEVNAVITTDVMDITVRFPAQETHYMIIRGIRPFARLQLYNMDFRSDPQFERYDSSGWAYYAQEQTLVLKMKHRTIDENIRIIFREAQAPQAPVPVTETDNTANEGNTEQ